MAAKPVLSPVEEQTPENEPKLRVFMNFEQAMLLADECRTQELDKIDFTFIGWNRGGHDGAFPQLFPVEPRFGGEAVMRRAIDHIQSLGHRGGFHDNYTGTYTLADNLDHADWMRDSSGKVIDGDLSGTDDLRLTTPENLERDVARLKRVINDITRLAQLQMMFLHSIKTPQPPEERRD